MSRIVVVGGGITGLTAAWRLRAHGEVTVLEAADRVGGKLRTERLHGVTVETGADAILAREPHAVDLCRELGLELHTPGTLGAQIWWDGRLHPLPDGVMLGAPMRVAPLLVSGLISPVGAIRAAADLVLPRRGDPTTMSVGELVRSRFGGEVAERLVDPLLSGVYAGDIDRLGAAACTPLLVDAARSSRSVMRGLRRRRGSASESGPLFVAVRGGLTTFAERLARDLDVRLRTPAQQVGRRGDRYEVSTGPGVLEADAVVVATPAFVAADLLRGWKPDAAEPLAEIPYASVAIVMLALPSGTETPTGSGVLVPRQARRVMKAATWVSRKWAHEDGPVIVRASVGGIGDEPPADDDTLVDDVRRDLAEVAGITVEPLDARVVRWPRSLPQYDVGHPERLRRVQAALEGDRSVVLAGAAYRGIGVAACVRQGEEAAASVLGAIDGG